MKLSYSDFEIAEKTAEAALNEVAARTARGESGLLSQEDWAHFFGMTCQAYAVAESRMQRVFDLLPKAVEALQQKADLASQLFRPKL